MILDAVQVARPAQLAGIVAWSSLGAGYAAAVWLLVRQGRRDEAAEEPRAGAKVIRVRREASVGARGIGR